MLKNECARNCWLAAAVAGLLVWIFNGTFFGGLALGLITLLLLGGLLRWLLCEGRGGIAEDAQVLTGRPEPIGHEDEGGILERAERAVVDASSAIATGAVSAVSKGREALRDMRDEDADDESAAHRDDPDAARPVGRDAGQGGVDDDRDDDDGLLERAEDRLERAGDAVKDAMGAVAARGKQALTSLSGNSPSGKAEPDRPVAPDTAAVTAPEKSDTRPAALYDPQISDSEAAPSDEPVSQVSPSGKASIPAELPGEVEEVPLKPAKARSAKSEKAEKPAKTGKKKKSDKGDKVAKSKKSEKPEKAGKSGKTAKAAKSARKKAAAAPEAQATATKAAQAASDDLKEIKGVGPQLERLLHDNGVNSFAQIAGWADADIDRFAGLIGRMGGRIRSDDWVQQAKILAAGGDTAFSRRVDKGEVY